MAGALEPEDPRFQKDVHRITLDGFDSGLQDYHQATVNHDGAPVERPRRNIPKNVLELLSAAERVTTPRRTDAICIVLGWSDDGLAELSRMLAELRQKAIWDGRAHAVGSRHPWKGTGITLACGYRDRDAIRATLLSAIRSQRTAVDSAAWAGFALDLAAPYDPMVVYYA